MKTKTVTLSMEIAGPYIRLFSQDTSQVVVSCVLNPPVFVWEKEYHTSHAQAVTATVYVGTPTFFKTATFKLGLAEMVIWLEEALGLDAAPFIAQAQAFGWSPILMERVEFSEEPTDE